MVTRKVKPSDLPFLYPPLFPTCPVCEGSFFARGHVRSREYEGEWGPDFLESMVSCTMCIAKKCGKPVHDPSVRRRGHLESLYIRLAASDSYGVSWHWRQAVALASASSVWNKLERVLERLVQAARGDFEAFGIAIAAHPELGEFVHPTEREKIWARQEARAIVGLRRAEEVARRVPLGTIVEAEVCRAEMHFFVVAVAGVKCPVTGRRGGTQAITLPREAIVGLVPVGGVPQGVFRSAHTGRDEMRATVAAQRHMMVLSGAKIRLVLTGEGWRRTSMESCLPEAVSEWGSHFVEWDSCQEMNHAHRVDLDSWAESWDRQLDEMGVEVVDQLLDHQLVDDRGCAVDEVGHYLDDDDDFDSVDFDRLKSVDFGEY